MSLQLSAFQLPKEGNSWDEMEDAFATTLTEQKPGAEIRFAVADGASASLLSGEWARILTRAACSPSAAIGDTAALLQQAGGEWRQWLAGYLQQRQDHNRPLRWYEEPGLRAGGHSTLLSVALQATDEAVQWQAAAIGDSCLFHVRQDLLLAAVPKTCSRQFTNQPALLAANAPPASAAPAVLSRGEWREDDELFLLTDALAQWFLAACERDGYPWRRLRFAAQESFAAFTADQRRAGALRNDDVTLLRITGLPETGPQPEPDPPCGRRQNKRLRRKERRKQQRLAAEGSGEPSAGLKAR